MIDWDSGTYERTATQLAEAAGRAVEAADLLPGDRVLDVGCGTGNAALLAAMRGARATGLDPAERLLQVAAGRARNAGIDADWVAGDALALPFADGAFDAVVSVFAVIFAPRPADAVAELVRVTAPEGRIVLTSWRPDAGVAAGSAVLRDALAAARPADAAPPAAGPAPLDWGDPDRVRALFAAHGLEAEVEEHGLPFVADSPAAFADEWMDEHPMWLAARPVLGDDAYAALREPLVAALEGVNEDPPRFRATSRYLVVRATRD
ncbi:class I SAM-dependent methyltransferase [Patulibacter sp. SYSU D01012]|uniref:class I SAM-dependent methyltransferase n=1 Tax=Patulibacter sp. SYSU D01012 TaxID=2817381 RepID=UPI001B3127A1